MKNLVTLLLLFNVLILQAQNLEVEGKARITEMDKVNTADSVVVRLEDGTLALRDVSTLSSFGVEPILVGSLGIGSSPWAVAVSGRLVFIVDNISNNLKVVDVSDPTAPVLLSSLGIGGNPWDVSVSGRYAYVVTSGGDFKVIDVSDPTSPVSVGSFSIGFGLTSVYVSGHYAYTVNSISSQLRVIDISDPTSPSLAGELVITPDLLSVYVSGRYAYVSSPGFLDIIDVSDPTSPSFAGSLLIGNNPWTVSVTGGYAYVVDSGSDDLKVIDVSDPTSPTLAGSLNIGSNPTSVFVTGSFAYVVDSGSDDLKVIDVSVPGSPALAVSLPIGSIPNGISVSGRYAYVVDSGSDDLKVIDVSGEEHTSVIAHSAEAGNLQVRNDIIAQGQLKVTGGITAGVGGIFSDGDVGISGMLTISNASDDGITIKSAGEDGIAISSAGSDGIFVENATDWSINIQGDKNLTGTPSGHIAQIYNRSTGTNADVLALKVGNTANPGSANNFITFFEGDDDDIGAIEGNGSGGVTFKSGSGDFAEYMPVLSSEEHFQGGDIVGVIDGKISLNTKNADHIMAISDRPIVAGNEPESIEGYQIVGFVGQLPVRVRGVVNCGDWIVSSGLNDGTGIAVSSSDITLEHQVLGPAWESSSDPGIKRINTAIGLDKTRARDVIIRRMEADLGNQQNQIDDIQRKIDLLGALIRNTKS